MQEKARSVKPKYAVHIIYACTFLLAILCAFSYMFWKQKQSSIIAENKAAKIRNCLTFTSAYYAHTWAKACLKEAEIVKSDLNNCIIKAKYDTALAYSYASRTAQKNAYLSEVMMCKFAHRVPNPAPDCSLPAYIADDLTNKLHQDETMCFKENA